VSAAKPHPDASQIWKRCDMTIVLRRRDPDGMWAANGVGYVSGTHVSERELLRSWRCVGIETPAVRVMVGERRVSDYPGDDPRVTVDHIADRGIVAVRPDGADFVVGCPADRVATWPLVTEPTPKPITIFGSHVIDASGAWCTRCGNEPHGLCGVDTDDARANVHRPRNGGPCPGCATCRPAKLAPSIGDALAKEPCAPGASVRAGQPVAVMRDPITGAAVAIPATAPPDPRTYARGDAFITSAGVRITILAEERAGYWRCSDGGLVEIAAYVERMKSWKPAPPDPRAERERYRYDIDAMLRGATMTERRAVMAACERNRPYPDQIPGFLANLRAYEAGRRRGMTAERARLEIDDVKAWPELGWCAVGLAAYERARSLP